MTNKQAIREIRYHIRHYKVGVYSLFKVAEALEMAIKALEKQIPKRPDLEGDGYDGKGNMVYDTWICPCCEKSYEVDYDKYEYCPCCGQNIDRSYEE